MGKLQDLKNAIGPGARANKYRVLFEIPDAVPKTASSSTFDILCVSASMPSRTIGTIEVHNQGRSLVLPGDSQYSKSWSLTFYSTEEHNIRRAMLEWMRSIDHFQDNMHSGVPAAIMTDMKIEQLDSAGNPTVRATLHNCFPTEVGELSYGDDQSDSILQVSVTFAFSDWVTGDQDLDKPLQYNSATRNYIA